MPFFGFVAWPFMSYVNIFIFGHSMICLLLWLWLFSHIVSLLTSHLFCDTKQNGCQIVLNWDKWKTCASHQNLGQQLCFCVNYWNCGWRWQLTTHLKRMSDNKITERIIVYALMKLIDFRCFIHYTDFSPCIYLVQVSE